MRIKPSFSFSHLLIVDPSTELRSPYSTLFSLLSPSIQVIHVQNIAAATEHLQANPPDLILISSQFSEESILNFLENAKASFTTRIAALMYTVDWSYRLHHLLGTSWAGSVGILHSLSSAPEILATLQRLQEIEHLQEPI
jgi:DNA-binding response OmpR family regulator